MRFAICRRALDQGHAIFAAQPKIGQEKIDLLAFEHGHGPADVGRHIDVILVLQQTAQPVPGVLLVIDDEDGGLDGIHGGSFGS